jgi:hypothetical protein
MANHHQGNMVRRLPNKDMVTLLHHRGIMVRLLQDNMERLQDNISNTVGPLSKVMVTLLHKDLLQDNMARLLLNKDMVTLLRKDLHRVNMVRLLSKVMVPLQALTAATSKHPQARLRRPVLATCLDKRHPSTCLVPLMHFAKP